jgi:hypothetical protein
MKSILLAITTVLPVLLSSSPASAQVFQLRTPVNFTLSGCTQLPPGLTVSGSGEGFLVLTTRVDHDGNTVMEQNDLVTGTATDSNGVTYGFNYHNHSTITVPPAGLPFSFTTTDHFNLVGKGQANELQVHFVANVTIYSLNPLIATFNPVNVHGNPFTCDPI